MKKQFHFAFVSVLNGFGYFGVMFEWLWIAIIVLPPLLKAGVFNFLIEHPEAAAPVAEHHTISSPFMIALAGLISLIVLGITVYVIIRLPLTVMKTGDKVTETASQKIVPILVHNRHQPLPPATKRRLTKRLKFYLCLAATLLPICLIFFVPPIKQMPAEVVTFVVAILALGNVLLFSAAYALTLKK